MRKKREIKSGIYKITNNITGQVYLGSSGDLYRRLRIYKNKSCYVTKNIKKSIQIYGIENHEFRIMCEFNNNIIRKELESYEDVFIRYYLHKLGEDKIFNSYTNSKDWMCKEYSEGLIPNNERRILMRKNNYNNRKIGKESPTSKKLNQYNLDGTFIRTWDCMTDVTRELGFNISHISSCCNNKRKSSCGFKWRYYIGNEDCSNINI